MPWMNALLACARSCAIPGGVVSNRVELTQKNSFRATASIPSDTWGS